MKRISLYIFVIVFFSACLKEEEPIAPIEPFGAEQTFEMGQYYQTQIFYRLEDNSIVSKNQLIDWDFSFNCSDGSREIRINNGRDMRAALTGKTDYESVTDKKELDFWFDACSGNPDSVVLGDWIDNEVAILDLGLDENSDFLPSIKIQFWKEGSILHFKYGPLDNSEIYQGKLIPDTDFNAAYFSVLNHKPVTIEPPKTEYDLNFCRYIYYFHEEETPYLVAGVLLNPYQTKGAKLMSENFERLTNEEITPLLTSANDAIGYSWKYYDFDQGAYSVVPNLVFGLQNAKGLKYKFRFTDFYSPDGIKGHPSLEFVEFKQ